jgi:GNAT superfamily N-acetyltransferase
MGCMTYTVRPVHEHEWQQVRDLRLRALRDEAASIAFSDTYAGASVQPDAYWQERTSRASLEAGDSASARQFVALDATGEWVGSAVALLEVWGEKDYLGEIVERDGGAVVGVYVDPAHRGAGVIHQLLDAAADWVRAHGLDRLRLHVHAENSRAQRAYERAGFLPTGVSFTGAVGPELEMARAL